MCSCPSHRGHWSSGGMVTDSSWKSESRLLRSVEMMTQRPVTGSFLSSGNDRGSPDGRLVRYVKSVSIYLNTRRATGQIHHDDVEPTGAIVQAVPGQVVDGHLG